MDNQGGYRSGISTCIQGACAWETLSEMEHMGGKVRDTEFRGAAFRDERTKLLFAYDYTNEKILVFGVQQDADAAVTDPLDEEDDTADLSTVAIRVLCIGN